MYRQAETELLLRKESEAGLSVQQGINVCAVVHFSLDVVSNKLHQAWQPVFEHLVASIAALNLDIGLQQSVVVVSHGKDIV